MRLSSIRKALTPPVMGALTWAAVVIHSSSAPITADEWLSGATLLAIGLGVYNISNDPAPVAVPEPIPTRLSIGALPPFTDEPSPLPTDPPAAG